MFRALTSFLTVTLLSLSTLVSNEGNLRRVSDSLLCVETPSYLLTVPSDIFLIILYIWVPLQGLVAIDTFDSESTNELELECVRDVGGRSKSRPAAANQLTLGEGDEMKQNPRNKINRVVKKYFFAISPMNIAVPDLGSRDRDVVLVRRGACWGNPKGGREFGMGRD